MTVADPGGAGRREPGATPDDALAPQRSTALQTARSILVLQRRAEEELARATQALEERTEQLQGANQELEAFSYSVSHDLRAPLRHISGFVALVQEDAAASLSEANRSRLATIAAAAARMATLIEDLLAFARVGRTSLHKTPLNLDQLVEETVRELRGETLQRDIVWDVHPLPTVLADRALLRIVLVNLLSNAVKFTGARAQARIEIGAVAEGGGDPVIFVADNGAGFDPDHAGKLFGVFQRLHSDDEFEGTGIGLTMVRRIVSRHGGRVWAEGAVDRGATFSFSLPRAA